MHFRVSVGLLNVLVNVFVLAVVLIGSEIARFTVYRATQLQLKKRRRAPIIADPDDTLTNVKQRLVCARRNRSPVVGFVVVLGILLVVAEISSEFGVESSDRCFPTHMETDEGLCATPKPHNSTLIRSVMAAFHALNAKWDDDELVQNPVYEGFRRDYNGRECFHLKPRKDARVILSNCKVSKPILIPGKRTRLLFRYIMSSEKLIVHSVSYRENNGTIRTYSGKGDLIEDSFDNFFALLARPLHAETGGNAQMFEYFDADDILEKIRTFYYNSFLSNVVGNATSVESSIELRSPVISYKLQCTEFADRENFVEAILSYRKVQLAGEHFHVKNITIDGMAVVGKKPMGAADIVRAGIASASTNPNTCFGETYVYQTCGGYDVIYMLPLIGIFSLITTCALVKHVLVVRAHANIPLPHTSSAWSEIALDQMKISNGDIEENVNPSQNMRRDQTMRQSRILPSVSDGYYELEESDGTEIVVFSVAERE